MSSEVILLFAGQGSRTIFSSASSEILLHKATRHRTAFLALERCYEAFANDLSLLTSNERSILTEEEVKSLTTPEDLVKPSTALIENPVIQAVTFYLHQVLEYILYTVSKEDKEEPDTLSEVAGFCSGILPALVVAAAPTIESPQFLEYTVGAFRLAFWIALRSALFSQAIAGTTWRDLPWSLVVAGLAKEELEAVLTETRFHVRYFYSFLGWLSGSFG
jgi:malonyl CoA-acyl carrier protein transacylase